MVGRIGIEPITCRL